MNKKTLKLVWRMVLNTVVGKSASVWDLYEEYAREQRLHVTIQEILEAKAKKIA